MKIVGFDESFRDDVIQLVERFHGRFVAGYDPIISRAAIEKSIIDFEGKQTHAFLLVNDDGKCVGLMAGIELKSYLNDHRIYSETFWYVDEPYGRYCFWFIHQVERLLKERGFSIVVMAVLNSDKAERIEKMYKMTGYRHLETHFIKNL